VLGLHTVHNKDGLDSNAKFIGFVYCFDIPYQRYEHEVDTSMTHNSQARW
jgi:hypothetical protein